MTMKALLPLLIGAAFAAHDASAQAAAPAAASNAGKFAELAQRPQMGWNTWNTFACNINEKLIKEAADAMVSSGMRDAGYVYLNIDDCWHGARDANGFIQADASRF